VLVDPGACGGRKSRGDAIASWRFMVATVVTVPALARCRSRCQGLRICFLWARQDKLDGSEARDLGLRQPAPYAVAQNKTGRASRVAGHG
jgi:hypothetical protein